MRELEIEATPEKAHQLLLRLGVWDELADPYPARAGIELENPSLALPPLPDEPREDLTDMISRVALGACRRSRFGRDVRKRTGSCMCPFRRESVSAGKDCPYAAAGSDRGFRARPE